MKVPLAVTEPSEERPSKGGSTAGFGPRALGPISAAVCNYNGEDYLPECLDALLAQEEALDEILVVDNGSGDGSLKLLSERYPQVRVVALGRNGGPGAARNAGMRAAKNRWVLAVDNDAVLAADVVGRLRRALEEDRLACLAQTRSVVYHEPERVHYDGAEFHYVGLLSLRNFFKQRVEAEGVGVLEANGFISICGLMDRDKVLELGGYDEGLFILFEDFDLALRLRIAGERLLIDEDAIVRHKAGTPGISFRAQDYPGQRAFFHSRNRWILLTKAYSASTLLIALPGLLIYESAWTLFAAKAGHFWPHLKGKLAYIEHLPETLLKRRRIQRARRVKDRELLVGGPLTLSPQLVAKPLARRMAGWLDGLLSGYWRRASRWLP